MKKIIDWLDHTVAKYPKSSMFIIESIAYCICGLIVIVFIGVIGSLLYGGCKACATAIGKFESANKARMEQRRKDELQNWASNEDDSIYPFIFEGHKYIRVRTYGSLCHAESCPCRTNKVEVVQ